MLSLLQYSPSSQFCHVPFSFSGGSGSVSGSSSVLLALGLGICTAVSDLRLREAILLV